MRAGRGRRWWNCGSSLCCTVALEKLGCACGPAFAFGEGCDAIRDSGTIGSAKQAGQWFVHWFAAETECAVVHGDHDVGIEIDEGAQGLFGAGVNGAVAVGEVGADGEKGDLGVKTPADFCEAAEICCVA